MRILQSAVLLFLLLREAASYEKADESETTELLTYREGDVVELQCLNRTIDTGEHITDKTGKLQYVPFAQCNETGAPLELRFMEGEGINAQPGLNCTIPVVTDEMYHLLEFYVHHDSPLSCRVRARPQGIHRALIETEEGDSGSGGIEWVPLIFGLTGKLESSHLHIANRINLLFHMASGLPGVIDSAAAYSTSAVSASTRIIIGDPLPLHFRVRWYESTNLPLGELRVNVIHGAGHMLFYCLLSAIVGAVGCYAWVVGVDVPRRLRRVTMG
ncbi:hypothetical protein BZA77DRAFT_233906, partial [Pyronema omphalodes]